MSNGSKVAPPDEAVALADIAALILQMMIVTGNAEKAGVIEALEFLKKGYEGKRAPRAAVIAEYVRREVEKVPEPKKK